jgi:hypothetical protein
MQNIASLQASPFDMLLARLPRSFDLETTARRHGALLRRRQIKSAADLLHVTLAYAAGGLSLRDTAAWAALSGLAEMSDVAVLDRLRGAADWLRALLGAILAERKAAAPSSGAGRRLRLIDATTVSGPGSAGVDWRVHAEYDLASRRLVDIEVTDGRGGESLGRFKLGPGEIGMADRCYAKAGDLRQVIETGGAFIVRMGWNALRLRTAEGGPFNLFAELKRLAPGEHSETSVLVLPERNRRGAVPMRLVMLRLPAAAAEQSRARARRRGQKEGKRTQPQTLLAAEYVLLVTSLDPAQFPAAEVLALYRLRWQIELVFKRLKSLIGLDQLRADDPDLARTWLYAKLIAALLAEDLTGELLDSPPSGRRHDAPPLLLDLAGPSHDLQGTPRRDHRPPHHTQLARQSR